MAWTKRGLIQDRDGIDNLSLSSDERYLLTSSSFERDVKIWDLEEAEVIASFSFESRVDDSVISPDGKFALVAAPNVFIWNLDKPSVDPLALATNVRATSLDISEQGRHAVIAAHFEGVYVWDLDSDTAIKSIKEKRTSYIEAAISPDRNYFAATVRDDNSIFVWRVDGRGGPMQMKGHSQQPIELVFLKDNRTVISLAENSEIIFWDVESGSKIRSMPARTGFAASPGGSFFAESHDWFIWIRDSKFDIVKEFRANGYVYDMTWGRSGNTLYIASGIGEVSRWAIEEPSNSDITVHFASDDWLQHAIRYLIALGFFESVSASGGNGVEGSVEIMFRKEYSSILSETHRYSELNLIRLMSLDRERVWWGDAECINHEGIYSELLTEWARISRGSFDPKNIEEKWAENGGSVLLSFEINGERNTIKPIVRGDYLDATIIPEINRITIPKGINFYVLDEPRDQTMVMLCLSKDEKRKLEIDLGLNFANLDLIPK